MSLNEQLYFVQRGQVQLPKLKHPSEQQLIEMAENLRRAVEMCPTMQDAFRNICAWHKMLKRHHRQQTRKFSAP